MKADKKKKKAPYIDGFHLPFLTTYIHSFNKFNMFSVLNYPSSIVLNTVSCLMFNADIKSMR